MTHIAVTGAGTTLGTAVLERLAADPAVTRVVGIDRRAAVARPTGVDLVRADLRDPVLARVLADADVVVHLNCADDVLRADDADHLRRLHGTRNLLEAVDVAGVGVVVHLSTAMVYGASERNDVPLTEDRPLRASPRFAAVHQATVADDAVRAFMAEHPDRRVVVLRSVPALGPGVDSAVSRHLESPVLPAVRGFDPPVQFVDVGDLAAAVHLVALAAGARGVYNVAADGWLTSSDVRHLLSRPALRLPRQIAVGAAAALHRLRLLSVPPEALEYLVHPWVVDTARLHGLGWMPVSSQRDILHRFVAEHGPWLSVGRVRVRTARLLAALAVMTAAAGLGGAWVTWRWWRARSEPHAAVDPMATVGTDLTSDTGGSRDMISTSILSAVRSAAAAAGLGA